MMKKLLFSLLFVGFALTVAAQDQFQNEAIGNLEFTKGRIAQLLGVIPDDKLGWSPADSVRSCASVVAHVVSANYFLGMKLGGTIPEGVDMMNMEKNLTAKADLTAALDQSHTFLIGAIRNMQAANFANKVEMPFPGDYTMMSIVNIALGHAHEHMGQLIAYARSNGVTPPWSAGN